MEYYTHLKEVEIKKRVLNLTESERGSPAIKSASFAHHQFYVETSQFHATGDVFENEKETIVTLSFGNHFLMVVTPIVVAVVWAVHLFSPDSGIAAKVFETIVLAAGLGIVHLINQYSKSIFREKLEAALHLHAKSR